MTYSNMQAAVLEIIKKAIEQIKPDRKKDVYCVIAGGSAVNYYLPDYRSSDDVDARFIPAMGFDPVAVKYIYNGEEKCLSLDTNYNMEFGLIHPDAVIDAVKIDEFDGVNLKILTPVDLAISKLSRFAHVDECDIKALKNEGLFTVEEFLKRAEEALEYYPTNPKNINQSIKELVDCWSSQPKPPI